MRRVAGLSDDPNGPMQTYLMSEMGRAARVVIRNSGVEGGVSSATKHTKVPCCS